MTQQDDKEFIFVLSCEYVCMKLYIYMCVERERERFEKSKRTNSLPN